MLPSDGFKYYAFRVPSAFSRFFVNISNNNMLVAENLIKALRQFCCNSLFATQRKHCLSYSFALGLCDLLK